MSRPVGEHPKFNDLSRGFGEDIQGFYIKIDGESIVYGPDGELQAVAGSGSGDSGGSDTIEPFVIHVVPERTFDVRVVAIDPAGTESGPAGVGHTLTANSNEALIIDDITMAVDDLVLIAGLTDSTSVTFRKRRGPYVVIDAGEDGVRPWVMTRHTSWDQPAETVRVSYFEVQEGTAYGGGIWYYDGGNSGVTFGSTRLSIKQYVSDSTDPNSDYTGTVITAARTRLVGIATLNGLEIQSGIKPTGATAPIPVGNTLGFGELLYRKNDGTEISTVPPSSLFGMFIFTGINGSGDLTVSGLPAGSKLIGAFNVADGTLVSALQGPLGVFEFTPTTTVNQLHQESEDDLSAKTFIGTFAVPLS